MNSRKLVLMVGVPGSGKSTKAELIRQDCEKIGQSCVVLSTDNYFYVDNKYVFDISQRHKYHQMNVTACGAAMDAGIEVVIIDNTNLVARDRKVYVQMAEEAGYQVHLEIVGCRQELEQYALRNKHGCTLELIKKCAAKIDVPYDNQ